MNILMLDYKRQLILNKVRSKKNIEVYNLCRDILKKEPISISEKNKLIEHLELIDCIKKGGLFESWIYDFIEKDV